MHRKEKGRGCSSIGTGSRSRSLGPGCFLMLPGVQSILSWGAFEESPMLPFADPVGLGGAIKEGGGP